MENQELDNEITVKQTQIRVELDPKKKAKLQKQLQKLQLKKEINDIKNKIKQLSK
jgi:hypothetical protein